ncbi:MAG TPA: MmcQ/YjbR family DNA-binding protein [Candidatus Dormibacteraeota bacterium]|nr:MmcQ/YjbR family DNA-binding protein [Candidatus Dormibacteraeota bacterium]
MAPALRYAFLMDVEWLRRFCLALPHTTEQIQWEDALVFKVGGRMYAVARLEPSEAWLSFKCGREEFAELVERPGVLPAPYLARADWAALESAPDSLPGSGPHSNNALSRTEIEALLLRSYELVFSKLPRKTQASLQAKRPAGSRRPRSRSRPKRRPPPR